MSPSFGLASPQAIPQTSSPPQSNSNLVQLSPMPGPALPLSSVPASSAASAHPSSKGSSQKALPSYMQSTTAQALLPSPAQPANYVSKANMFGAKKTLVPLNRLNSLEVEHHLKSPRNQFAFLDDIKKYRLEKVKNAVADAVTHGSAAINTVVLEPLPAAGAGQQKSAKKSKPLDYTIPGPAHYTLPSPSVTNKSAGTAAFTSALRFPTPSTDVPSSFIGSLKSYPIEAPKAVVRKPVLLKQADTNTDGTSTVPISTAPSASAVQGGVFKLTHGYISYFGISWDVSIELPRQISLLNTMTHPSVGLRNSILKSNDIKLDDLTYDVVATCTLAASFNVRDITVSLMSLRDEHELMHNKSRIVRLTAIYNRARVRSAFPKFVDYCIADRELERFAASVEIQKCARIYISKGIVHRIIQHNNEMLRRANIALYTPIISRWLSRVYRGYIARKKVKVLQSKRRAIRLLIKVQTRFRMILARNRKRHQKESAQMWRSAKLVQRNWRFRKGIKSSKDVLIKFGELKQIIIRANLHNSKATMIQTAYRSYTSYKTGPLALEKAMAAQTERNSGATTIQSAYRGVLGRKHASECRIQHTKRSHLGIHCQRIVRGFLSRIHYHHAVTRMRKRNRDSCIVIQRSARGYIGRLEAKRLRYALYKNVMADRIIHLVIRYLGRCRFKHKIVAMKGDHSATCIQSLGRRYIVRQRIPFYVQERRRWDNQRPISRGYRRYRGMQQSKIREMMIESGYCGVDVTQKAVCYFEYTGQFLCEKSLRDVIRLMEVRGESWKYENGKVDAKNKNDDATDNNIDDDDNKTRNLYGNIWDLNFFISSTELKAYKMQESEYKKDELSANAAISTEMNAIDTLNEQIKKCSNDTQIKTLSGIIKRRNANLSTQRILLSNAKKRIANIQVFLRRQIWEESNGNNNTAYVKRKTVTYVNRFTGETRRTVPVSYWRAIACATSIQRYYRLYNARLIADVGSCDVFPMLSSKYVCYFDPPGSGIMKMSLKGKHVYLNDGKGMMKRHIVKTHERVAVEEKSAKLIHRICKKYRVKMKFYSLWEDIKYMQSKGIIVLQKWWRSVTSKIVFNAARDVQRYIENECSNARKFVGVMNVSVPDSEKLQEKLALARAYEIEAADAKKRIANLYATQYVDDYDDIIEVTKVALAKEKELNHIVTIENEVAKSKGE
jgi:hypothetical protein